MLAEQDRITSQLTETDEVLSLRKESLAEMIQRLAQVESQVRDLAVELDRVTETFVSDKDLAATGVP
jgi:DNA repair exonuclease SbcCD nuclease subunit